MAPSAAVAFCPPLTLPIIVMLLRKPVTRVPWPTSEEVGLLSSKVPVAGVFPTAGFTVTPVIIVPGANPFPDTYCPTANPTEPLAPAGVANLMELEPLLVTARTLAATPAVMVSESTPDPPMIVVMPLP